MALSAELPLNNDLHDLHGGDEIYAITIDLEAIAEPSGRLRLLSNGHLDGGPLL